MDIPGVEPRQSVLQSRDITPLSKGTSISDRHAALIVVDLAQPVSILLLPFFNRA